MLVVTGLLLCCSIQRNFILTVSDIAIPLFGPVPTSPLHLNLAWPTLSGITEAEARTICQAPIVDTAIFALCSNYTTLSLEIITSNCMLDLLV